MRVLLDENLPHRLRAVLSGHDARTTAYQGWAGLANGALLRAADEASFDAVISADHGIRYQQNRINYRLALIIANLDSILAALNRRNATTNTSRSAGHPPPRLFTHRGVSQDS